MRELHDEVINGAIVLNVPALQRLLANLRGPTLRAELQLVLETEQSVIEGLRMISERVRPTGRGDPLGLEAVLRVSWWQVPPAEGVPQGLAGIGLGTAAFLSVAGIAASQGWASAPAWGWTETSRTQLLQSVAFLAVSHLAVAGNEELVFRGYGLATLRATIGPVAAAAVLTTLFALFHERRPQVLLGQAVTGATLMVLRLTSGSLWMPVGYHWAWNVM